MAIVAKASARSGGMFSVLDQLHWCCKLLMTLSARCVRFHFLRELAPWIPAVHLMARNAGDALAGFACTKALRARHSLILVSGEARRAVPPETRLKTEGADLVFALHRPVELKQILSGIVRIAIAHHCPDAIARLRETLSMAMSAHHRGAIGIKFGWDSSQQETGAFGSFTCQR